jgi:hypothetical protein
VKLETDDLDKIINSEMAKVESKKIKNNIEFDLGEMSAGGLNEE